VGRAAVPTGWDENALRFDNNEHTAGEWKMLITELVVRQIFEDLIVGKIERETADRWAYETMQALDRGDLDFESRDLEEQLWSSVLYL